MARVPTYQSSESLQPTPLNPNTASALGSSVVNLAEGLGGIADVIQKIDDKRQTLKAETYLAQSHRKNNQIANTDPNIDGLEEKINNQSEQDITNAANLIKSPEARNSFIEKAQLDVERRNLPIYNTILRRKSQDFKASLIQANDEDIKEYQTLGDPAERQLIKQKIMDRTKEAIVDGHINKDWGVKHVDTLLKEADLNQVKNDMSVNAELTYQQLQKGKEGLYPDISPKAREQFASQAQKMIAKQGSENKLIYGIAQNHAENQIIDMMAQNKLTQETLNNAQLMGLNGIRIRPEFAKAASEALNDPFPTESVPDKYNALFHEVTNVDKKPGEVKLDILRARGITPAQKAHLMNAALREDDSTGSKQSINAMIQTSLKDNKQQIMELNKKIEKEVASKRTLLGKIGNIFADHAKDDAHLADLQGQLMEKIADNKENLALTDIANDILNKDTLNRNPKIATAESKGTIFMDKTTNVKRRYYPDGHWEPVK